MTLDERIVQIEAALKPFAEWAALLGFPDDWRLMVAAPHETQWGPTVGDCRKAKEVYDDGL